MAYSAVLMALSVVLTRFASFYIPGATWFRLGFGSIPIIVASIICGPFWGGLVGAGADLIGANLFPSGAYFYGYTIDAALQGILPYLALLIFKGRKKTEDGAYFVFAGIICLVSVLFVSMFSTYRKQELYTWARVLIPCGFSLYFVIVFFLFFFLRKTKVFALAERSEKKVSLMDIYLIELVNETVIAIGILGIWTGQLYQIPYFYSAFTQIIIFTVNGILRLFIVYFLVNALLKTQNISLYMMSFVSRKSLVKQEKADDIVNGSQEEKRN
jgi:ECF transporter S component (folate family)